MHITQGIGVLSGLTAPCDLQPNDYGNGVFDNVYLLALDNTKR